MKLEFLKISLFICFFVQNSAHSLGKTISSALYIIPFLPGKADAHRVLQKFEQNSG